MKKKNWNDVGERNARAVCWVGKIDSEHFPLHVEELNVL